ncbi:MAG TPA: hypothetical protein VME67_14445 [Mycobacterium sp.]|nr:hypothetical protein [Mycobacterium sp.]HTX95945.1 hypothetical protein [Mycobacterium sp.]
MAIDNPYWEAVKDCVEADCLGGNPVVGYFSLDRTVAENMAQSPNRQLLVRKYCWTIPDPDTVAFVARHADGGLVDPIAGTGYWAYLLAQAGVDVVCYDLNPGTDLVANGWHGSDLYAQVCAKDCAEAAARHPDRTLFLSWPPHGQDVGARILLAYSGNHVIYVGDGRGGATGDEQMHQILEKAWSEVDSRQPVLWWGQHDRVTVYERCCGPTESPNAPP